MYRIFVYMIDHKPKFYLWVTILLSLLLVTIFIFFLKVDLNQDPLDNLDHPFETGSRIFERDLELAVGMEKVNGWKKYFYDGTMPPMKEAKESAIKGYEELQKYALSESNLERNMMNSVDDSAMVSSRLMILYLETGERTKAKRQADELIKFKNGQSFVDEVHFAYGIRPEAKQDNAHHSILNSISMDRITSSWAEDQLNIRLARKRGDLNLVKSIEIDLFKRSDKWSDRNFFLSILFLTVLISGLTIFAMWLVVGRKINALGLALVEAPWLCSEGYAVMIRSAFWAFVFLAGTSYLENLGFPHFFYLWGSLFASLPMLWLVHKYLLKANKLTFKNVFGLTIPKTSWRKLICFTLCLAFVDQAGSLLIDGFIPIGDAETASWTEYVDEELIWGNSVNVMISFTDGVLWAPLLEEIGFRGLMYTTLRRRLSPWIAITLTAFIFSGVHFYSISGFLQIFWSGLVWSFAYEKSRSLVPGILCHAFNNLYIMVGMVLMYR